MKLFSIYDGAAKCFLTPFSMRSQGEAIRAFGDSVGDSSQMISKHPEDFTLWFLGVFDEETGDFNTGAPERISKGLDFVDPSLDS
jgi:hypothetical protein